MSRINNPLTFFILCSEIRSAMLPGGIRSLSLTLARCVIPNTWSQRRLARHEAVGSGGFPALTRVLMAGFCFPHDCACLRLLMTDRSLTRLDEVQNRK